MWIQERGKNSRLADRYKDPLTGKYKIVSIVIKDKRKKTIKEAQIALTNKINKLISEVKSGKIVHGITFKQLLDEYSEYEKAQIKRSTYYNHQTMINTLTDIFDPDSLVENFTSLVLTEKLEELMYGDRNLSSGYVSKYKYYLHKLFEYAVKHSYIKENPIDKVELNYKSPVSGQQIKDKFLEESELKAVLKYLYNNTKIYGELCEWLYLTGLRIGEATSLSFDDVYQKNGDWFIDITGTLEYKHIKAKDQKKSDSPKTLSSSRTVFLPKKAIKIYLKLKRKANGKGFIFATENGTPIQTTSVNTVLRSAKKKLKLDKSLSTHTFRHTHISKLAELGVPLYVIQQRVGHANSKITAQIYLHVRQGAIKKEASKLDKL
ncbi:site-specific integrase [Limosilactobacillus sp. STM2_1]|uniref:Site-specific integrase n=1 Tax=Limosilactobacillus rudii TaxID=2759755 RepID=A0A7W3UL68_9LACO|nr:site-specific integrase [Limosilactobacillus rudii]MBB1080191.1 site-specific integrase [Limosilactobacillus rudii]MBB1096905.1 site-specific integrase [Limosilactobacillus rudii]MCD7133803.1 site-specific integrase [Limosilactobacillus rudii]